MYCLNFIKRLVLRTSLFYFNKESKPFLLNTNDKNPLFLRMIVTPAKAGVQIYMS